MTDEEIRKVAAAVTQELSSHIQQLAEGQKQLVEGQREMGRELTAVKLEAREAKDAAKEARELSRELNIKVSEIADGQTKLSLDFEEFRGNFKAVAEQYDGVAKTLKNVQTEVGDMRHTLTNHEKRIKALEAKAQ